MKLQQEEKKTSREFCFASLVEIADAKALAMRASCMKFRWVSTREVNNFGAKNGVILKILNWSSAYFMLLNFEANVILVKFLITCLNTQNERTKCTQHTERDRIGWRGERGGNALENEKYQWEVQKWIPKHFAEINKAGKVLHQMCITNEESVFDCY